MIEISGKTPESLPTAEDIKTVKGKLKQARREFVKLDKPKGLIKFSFRKF
jgi:DNA-damage-inducible protein D